MEISIPEKNGVSKIQHTHRALVSPTFLLDEYWFGITLR
jgi:hypothetical protein